MFALSSLDINVLLNFVLFVGLVQLSWVAVIMRRKGLPPRMIWLSSQAMFAVWVVLWPAYTDTYWVGAGLLLVSGWVFWTALSKRLFFIHLKQAWSVPGQGDHLFLWPPMMLIASLSIAWLFFLTMPEFGTGMALCAVWSFPLASSLDRLERIPLRFPMHPDQTLPGHLTLVMSVALLCIWSIHLYHGLGWQQIWMATTMAGIAAALVWALMPRWINQPLAILALGGVLWAL